MAERARTQSLSLLQSRLKDAMQNKSFCSDGWKRLYVKWRRLLLCRSPAKRFEPLPASVVARKLVNRRTKQVQRIIPGGKSMETSCLLKEMANYIVALKKQLMMEAVESGEGFMPHRTSPLMIPCSEKAAETPIRKISRNRGRVVPAALEVQEDERGSDNNGGGIQRPALKKRNKRLLCIVLLSGRPPLTLVTEKAVLELALENRPESLLMSLLLLGFLYLLPKA